jgi:hypothetical protein
MTDPSNAPHRAPLPADTAVSIIRASIPTWRGQHRPGTLSLHHSGNEPPPPPYQRLPPGFVDFGAVVDRSLYAHPCPDLYYTTDPVGRRIRLAWIPVDTPQRWEQPHIDALPFYLAVYLTRTPDERLLNDLQNNQYMRQIEQQGHTQTYEAMVRGLAMLIIEGPYCLHSPNGKIYPALWMPSPRYFHAFLQHNGGTWTQRAIDTLRFPLSRLLGQPLDSALLKQLETVMHNSNHGPAPDPATAALAYDVYRSLLQTHFAHSPLSTATEQRTRAKNDRA